VEALAEAAVQLAQHLDLLAPLDAFGDDVEVERRGKPQDRVDECAVRAVAVDAVDERASRS
jgi:hypothetical protein